MGEIGAGIQLGPNAFHYARVRNAIMGAKTSEDYYRDLAWLYGGTGLTGYGCRSSS